MKPPKPPIPEAKQIIAYLQNENTRLRAEIAELERAVSIAYTAMTKVHVCEEQP